MSFTMRLYLLVCFHTCVACATGLELQAPPRDMVPFDYTGRFRIKPAHAPPPPPPPPPTPPGPKPDCSKFNTTRGSTCSGLKATTVGNASAAACKAACCNEAGCTVYQFQAVGTNPTSNCWTGTCLTPLRGVSPTWKSGAVPTAPPVPPAPPAAPPASKLGWATTILDSAVAEGAVCLDGSAPGYHLQPKDPRRWTMHLQGGGWCTSVQDCFGRSNGALGSSRSYEADMDAVLASYDGGAHGITWDGHTDAPRGNRTSRRPHTEQRWQWQYPPPPRCTPQ